MNTKLAILCISFSVGLVACGGGGGGGGGGSVSVTPFSNWAAIQPNSQYNLSGGYSYLSAYNGSQGGSGGSATVTLDGSSNLSAFKASTPYSSVSFNTANGDGIVGVGYILAAVNKSQTSVAVIANPSAYGWLYQTYGTWATEGPNFAGSSNFNAVSVGAATPVSGMPSTGTATFTGNAGGMFGNVAGAGYLYSSAMSAGVNFGSRTINFATSGTVAASVNSSLLISAPGLNVSGVLGYGAGSNQFGGRIVAANGMIGAASGQFYGPNANEIGGTYVAGSPSIGAMIGGFGGKR